MVSQEEIKAFQWIELPIKNEDKKVGAFEWQIHHDRKEQWVTVTMTKIKGDE